jgi:prefoldin subunit 5
VENQILQVGAGGLLALLILREVFGFLRKKSQRDEITEVIEEQIDQLREPHKEAYKKIEVAMDQINDLWRWHNVSDAEGVKIWYVRRSLEDAIGKLAVSIDKMTDLMGRLWTEVHDVKREISAVSKRMNDVK